VDEQMSKTKLLEEVRAQRRLLEAALAQVPEAKMAEPGVQGHWSVKDILAHVVFWEQHLCDWLRANRGEVPAPEPVETDADVDRLNAENYARHRDRPLADVVAEFRRSFEQVQGELAGLTEADLTEAGRTIWLADQPLWDLVAMDTSGHYREHREAIQAWLG